MGFFSELWEGAKTVGKGLLEIIGALVSVLFEGAFWLVGKIFDAIEALFDFIDDMIEAVIDAIGSFFTSDGKDGEAGVLPPTPEVIGIIEKYDKEYSTDYKRKAREGKATLGYIQDGNGKVVGASIVGSDKGFDSKIGETHKRKRIYATRIKD